jgi:hypothetical protein
MFIKRRPLQKLTEPLHRQNTPNDVRKTAGGKGNTSIATRKKNMIIKVRRMVYSQIAGIRKSHSYCFSYQLPSPTHAAINPPASQVFQPLQQDQEAYENETRRTESERSKIQLWGEHQSSPLRSSRAQQPSRPPWVPLQQVQHQHHRCLRRSRG